MSTKSLCLNAFTYDFAVFLNLLHMITINIQPNENLAAYVKVSPEEKRKIQ